MVVEQSTTEKTSTTKLIAVFFPLKPLKNKFSENFISIQIADFIPKLVKFTQKVIIYKIDKERFYTYDLQNESFDNKFDVVDNQTIVIIFSVDKTSQIDVSNLFEPDFSKSINTIRIHRKRVDSAASETTKPSYIFYTINSTKLLNSIVPIIQNDNPEKGEATVGKTYFILGANNAKRDINPLEKSFTTEKICRMNYITTVDFDNIMMNEEYSKTLKKKINNQIKI